MNRRRFLGLAAGALAGGVFVPKFERWFRPTRTGLWLPGDRIAVISGPLVSNAIGRIESIDWQTFPPTIMWTPAVQRDVELLFRGNG